MENLIRKNLIEAAYESGYEKGRMDALRIPMAHWVYKPLESDMDLWLYHCSICSNLSARPRAFCAECGAKMEEKVEQCDG